MANSFFKHMQQLIEKQFGLLQELEYMDMPVKIQDIKPRSIPFNTNIRQVHDLLNAYERIGGKLVTIESEKQPTSHAQVSTILNQLETSMDSLRIVCKRLMELFLKHTDLKTHIQTSLTNRLLHTDYVSFTKKNLPEIIDLNDKVVSHYKLIQKRLDLKIEFFGLILTHQLHHLEPLKVSYKDQSILNLYFTYIQAYKDFMDNTVQRIIYPQYVAFLNDVVASVKRINSAQSMSLLYMIYWDLLLYLKYYRQLPIEEDTIKLVKSMLSTVTVAAKTLLESIHMDILQSATPNEKLKQHMERIKKFFWGKDIQSWVALWTLKEFNRASNKEELSGLIDGYFTAAQRQELQSKINN